MPLETLKTLLFTGYRHIQCGDIDGVDSDGNPIPLIDPRLTHRDEPQSLEVLIEPTPIDGESASILAGAVPR